MNITNETDRVRRHTSPKQLRQIDEQIEQNIRAYGSMSPAQIDQRIRELQREWDMERYLQANASVIGIASAVLGVTVNRKWLIFTGTVMSFLLQHSVQGWCPPVPIFRSRGVRTRGEIDRELYALKALRGDFKDIKPVEETSAPSEALRAATA